MGKKHKKKKLIKKQDDKDINKSVPGKPVKQKKINRLKTAIKEKRTRIKEKFESENKKWAIIMICGAAVFALLIQSWLEAGFNPDAIKNSFGFVKTSAMEALKVNNNFDITNTNFESSVYAAPGETDKEIFSFEIGAGSKTVLFKELKLTKSGSTPSSRIVRLKLIEAENVICEAQKRDDDFTFKKFTSVLQPGTNKKYIVKADFANDTESGTRLKFSLDDPYDIGLFIDDSAYFALDTFPFEGPYTTIVGWRKK